MRAVRKHFGDPERDDFAERLGVAKTTLANYERGERIPDASVLALYRLKLGINVNWLATDEGSMFDDPSKAPPQAVKPELMEKLARLASGIYREMGRRLPSDRATFEATELYNDLVQRVVDVTDQDEVEATLPQLAYQLRKRLKEAAAEPGTGKREAS